MRRFVLFFFILLLAVCSSSAAFAQMNAMPQYNRLTFMQVAARVESVNTLQNPHSGRYGMHLFARDAFSNRYLVHICPQWYAENHPNQFTFNLGDQLIISGSRFATGLTQNNIFAATIVNCSRSYLELRIRDPYTGSPLWDNQPDNLLEKIQEIQKKLFSKRSQFVRQSMDQIIASKTNTSYPPIARQNSARYSYPSQNNSGRYPSFGVDRILSVF
ncbi:hypothetical protein [Candidatus Electronema sp. PJ]|uniref:hypothetical protein n=1 Tax=Candidatus Electronema sp. PJ TaxID=3401572 RepID=UPI003AA7D5D1